MGDFRENLRFGVKTGFNVSNVWDAKGDEFVADPKAGFVLGAFLAIPISKFLGFQPEIQFSQKGFTAKGKFLGSEYRFTRTSNHIDVPLLLQLKPSNNISIVAGPQYSFLSSYTDTYKTDFGTIEDKKKFENDNIRKNLLGVVAGVDVYFGRYILVSGRASWDLINNRGDGSSNTPQYKNQLLQLTVGIGF